MAGLLPDFGVSPTSAGSAQFANPLAKTPITDFGNAVAGALPQNMWSGTPLRNLFGVSQAYASDGKGAVLGANTTNTGAVSSGPGQNYTPNNASYGPSQLQQLQAIAPRDLNPDQLHQLQVLQQQQDPYAGVRNDISSSWDNYLNSLNDTSGYLGDQRTAQEGIANSQFSEGSRLANDQKAKSLRDIANTTRNAFQAGNNYLGSLGAGDSSAANQYSFAINQEAGKQTGDLNNFVSGQIQGLQSQHDQQIQSIASWFAQQQQALKQQIAQGQLNKGQDLANLSKGILDQAMQATNQIKANTQNQYNGLLSWAANNATNMGQLQQNIAGIPRAMGQIQSTGGVGSFKPQYGGAPATTKTDIFGNPIQ